MKTINRRQWLKHSAAVSAALGVFLLAGFEDATIPEDINEEDEVRRLLYNENHLGPDGSVKKVIREVLHRSNRYATFFSYDAKALKQLIAEQEGLSPENVLLGHGSFEPLLWLATHLGSKGEHIIVPSPTFDVVGLFARKIGAEVTPVEVGPDFKMNLDDMEARIAGKTSLLTLCNPNNPTGTNVEPGRLRSFCRLASAKTTVLVDEAYIHYLDSWRTHTMAPLIGEGKNIVVTRTFSKIYGMAGLRIGFMLGPPELIKAMETKFTLGFPGNMPNSLSVASAIAALRNNTFVTSSQKKNSAIRSAFYRELDTLQLKYMRSNTNFVYFDVTDFKAYKALMWKHKILLAGGWPTKPNWARVTMGADRDMEYLLDKMKGKKWL
ncbi:MAG: histidinol-phosphate transaminase [Bacteroidota bacterium]